MRKAVPFSSFKDPRRECQVQAAALCEAFAACFLAAAFSSSTSKKVFFSPLPRSFWKKLATTAPETLCQSAPTADGRAVIGEAAKCTVASVTPKAEFLHAYFKAERLAFGDIHSKETTGEETESHAESILQRHHSEDREPSREELTARCCDDRGDDHHCCSNRHKRQNHRGLISFLPENLMNDDDRQRSGAGSPVRSKGTLPSD